MEYIFTNFQSFDDRVAHEKATHMLAKAKEREKALRKQGWQDVQLPNGIKVFVPCDKKGNPTKEGKKRIEELMKC